MASVALQVKIKGLDELRAKLNYHLLEEPEVATGMETIAQRFKRGGRGLGARNNTVNFARTSLSNVHVRTTLNHPRQTGAAWLRKQIAIFNSMAPRVARSVIKKINARWAA
jgi:hypothetical protein